jgi:Tol biopolymer transport system component
VIYTRPAPDGSGAPEVRAVDRETAEDSLLLSGPYGDPTVDPTGTRLALLHSSSHYNMDAFVLPLEPPSPGAGVPRAAGEPRRLTEGQGRWHTHNLAWFPDGESFVYTRDADRGDIWLLERPERRRP